MRIFLAGHDGLIGKELIQQGYEYLHCDILDMDDVIQAVNEAKPDVIIHCAEMSYIDYCEEHMNEAMAMNMRSVNNVIHDFYGTFIYLSTSNIFNGEKRIDYRENHRPDPLSIYGFSKWAGEKIASFRKERTLVVRTSQLFNLELVETAMLLLKKGVARNSETTIKRSFLYVPHFVDSLIWVIERLNQFPTLDVLNIAGKDTMSYYDFWLMASKVFSVNEKLIVATKERDALVPENGGLNIGKAKKLGMPLYSALDGLKQIKMEMENEFLWQGNE